MNYKLMIYSGNLKILSSILCMECNENAILCYAIRHAITLKRYCPAMLLHCSRMHRSTKNYKTYISHRIAQHQFIYF